MSKKHIGFFEFIRRVKTKPKHWENARELQSVLHKLPDFMEAVMLELTSCALTEQEIIEFIDRLHILGAVRNRKKIPGKMKQGIDKAIRLGIFIKNKEKIELTPAGREVAAYAEKAISLFMRYAMSERTSSFFTLVLHIVLSVFKFLFGLLSFSAGLIADAVDNTMDTLAAVGIWVGIKMNKQRLVALFIIVLMFISLAGVLYVSVIKLLQPGPVDNGWNAFVVSLLCGLAMLMLSAYQYLVGKKTANFAILCQAVDSRNHVLTSLLVCTGILISFLAQSINISWLYYADAGVSFIIGFLIFKSALELIKEFRKPRQEEVQVKHFMSKGLEQTQQKSILLWLKLKVSVRPFTKKQLIDLFTEDFLKRVPKLLKIINIDFHNITLKDFEIHIDNLIELHVLRKMGDVYTLNNNLKQIKCRRIRWFLRRA